MEELPRSNMKPLSHLDEEEKTLFRCPTKSREAEKSKTEEKDVMLTLTGKIDYTHQDTIKIILRGRHA